MDVMRLNAYSKVGSLGQSIKKKPLKNSNFKLININNALQAKRKMNFFCLSAFFLLCHQCNWHELQFIKGCVFCHKEITFCQELTIL